MTSILIRHARVLTMDGKGGQPGPKRGPALGDLGALDDAWVVIENGHVRELGSESRTPPATPPETITINAQGRVVMPGFVDCHTHACWAGDRLDEWDQKRAGVPYLEILKGGGGIMSTVRAVREATQGQLTESLLNRLHLMLAEGTTMMEVKTGYGLSVADEAKMLGAILEAARRFPGTIIPTALLGHALDPAIERETFIATMIGPAREEVRRLWPPIPLDAFCESGAWTLEECASLFERTHSYFRVHADQFNALGMTEWAVDHGAESVDHLEASTEAGLRKLAASDTFGVMLPACGFHLDGRYAKGRAFVDMGGALAIATNLNPGSAPCFSMPFIIALAVRHLGLTPAEAISAATTNPAELLGLPDRGWIGPGARADLIVLRHTDERNLAFEFGGRHVDEVIQNGIRIQPSRMSDG